MAKAAQGTENIVKTTARVVTISVLVFVVGLYLIATIMNRHSAFLSISLTEQEAVYTITETDGRTVSSETLPSIKNGQTLTWQIQPLGDTEDIQNGVITFSLYHCYVTAYCGDTLIYAQTEPEQGKLIGHRYYIIPLPEGYENETITLVITCAEDASGNVQNPQIIPADRATYAFRSGHYATGILMLTLLVSSLFMSITSLFTWIRDRHYDGMGAISLLSASICLWYMGFEGTFQPLVESIAFLAVVEYVGIYITPVALSFFIQKHTTNHRLHLFCVAWTCFLLGIFVFTSFMTAFVSGISYLNFIRIDQGLLLFTMILLFAAEIRERHVERQLGEKILHVGVTISLSVAILEIVRYLLVDQFHLKNLLLSKSIMPLCILALAFTVLMYYGVQVSSNQYRRIEQENLQKLAFLDQLTGAPNRAACYARMDEMRKSHCCDYVVTFIDINFLKKTNDTWGHEKGDELIRTASDLLKKHFTGDDFFGRWGGDEFVAVHFGTLEETKNIMTYIQQDIDAMNHFGRRDFTLSESWGFGESTSEDPIDPDEAIRRADAQMYEEKQRVHAARQ